MLYDNSQLARVHLHAWQVIGNEFLRTIAEEILDCVIREMTGSAEGFYSTQDADARAIGEIPRLGAQRDRGSLGQ